MDSEAVKDPKKFWTITDADTTTTNSRSTRFPTLEAAINAAKSRIAGNYHRPSNEVFILKAVALVKREQYPIVVELFRESPDVS